MPGSTSQVPEESTFSNEEQQKPQIYRLTFIPELEGGEESPRKGKKGKKD